MSDPRLIEDYIPIEAISAEARREKSVRKGHICTLHLWWARRPLVAARAAVYGALVPAPTDKQGRDEAATFVTDLCKYPGSRDTIAQAQRHILQAHAARLSAQRGHPVTVEDIEAGRAPRPRVLDMFAGGGAIPLEALRLGCEAYALDLNPVAHLIELCTLVYPQQFGAIDPAAKGCADDGTWAGLAAEVEHWGKWVLDRVRTDIGDLYPPIPDPRAQASEPTAAQLAMNLPVRESRAGYRDGKGFLTPVAYLWTRTVRCKNPACGGTVPLARQTWLAKKPGRYIALRPDAETYRNKPPGEKRVRYEVVQAATPEGLGFDPATGSQGGSVACPFCGTVVDGAYVMTEGHARRIGAQPLAVACTQPHAQGKVYFSTNDVPAEIWREGDSAPDRTLDGGVSGPQSAHGANVLDEPVRSARPSANARGLSAVTRYGFLRFADLFTQRQATALFAFANVVRQVHETMSGMGYKPVQAEAVSAYLGLWVDRLADYNSSFCTWHNSGEKIGHTFARQALPMVWDFVELNPLGNASGNARSALQWILDVIESSNCLGLASSVIRGSASQMPFDDTWFDAIVTDPPYYDNVPYADLSDFFYVWLKRSVGFLFPQDFSSLLTPKKNEAIMDASRHGHDEDAARMFYEHMMADAFQEAGRCLRPGAPLVIVYAHKTTVGWATLVDALRRASFTVTEAWPLDTEMEARVRAVDTASLASSIFLVARRREGDASGSYEHDVQPELQRVVRERVERLWQQGVTGADLVIACVGAGLRAFTRFARVEYANGQEVPAESFLAEVEGAVLEALLERLFGVSRAGFGGVDAATRFYVLWRYAYRQAALDGGEAIVFAYPQHVELDGAGGVSSGNNPLVEKAKGKYRLRDYAERGADENLGLPRNDGGAPLIDVLQRVLWLMENRPALIQAYLDQARCDVERLRLVAQTLAGQTLAGNGSAGGRSLVAARGAEASALRKLTANWRTLIEAQRGTMI